LTASGPVAERNGGAGSGNNGQESGMIGLATGQCVRVVPSRIKVGALEGWLAAHEKHHTPAVRRQPGFVCKMLVQAAEDEQQVAMLLVWQSSAQAVAWTNDPQHDAAGAPLREFADRAGERVTSMPRGGWTVLQVTEPADAAPLRAP
jgi:heme-degrading monooxygenase HmoA